MPERLYRDDSYLARFTARVTAAHPDGSVTSVELDRTAFYPTGGGQPHDTGRLGSLEVIDVREAGDGRILHVVRGGDAGLTDVAREVACELDWSRRFDHMQQHTGQHILSRAFVEVAGASTRSFHLGESSCTIDIDLGGARAGADDETERMVRSAEARANEVIFGDRPVSIALLDASRAGALAADKSLARELALKPGDAIRLIQIGDFDETPCGGTHVRRTGEVGAVAVRSWERFKGGTRVAFVCGGRVVRSHRQLGAVVDACVAKLSTQPADLPAGIDRLQDQLASARRANKDLTDEVVGARARARDAGARIVGQFRILLEQLAAPAAELQPLARAYVDQGDRVALLASTEPGAQMTTLLFARSEPASAGAGTLGALNMGEILGGVCRARGGKGGGGAGMARGGGVPAAEAGACLEEAFAAVVERLAPR